MADQGAGKSVWVDGSQQKTYAAIEHLSVSSDGSHVAYTAKLTHGDWVLVVDGVEGPSCGKIGSPVPNEGDIKKVPLRALFFSPDGKHYAYTAEVAKQNILFVDGKEIGRYAKLAVPVFSPDGQHVAVWAKAENREFVVLDGQPQPAFEKVDPWQLIFSPDSRRLATVVKNGKLNSIAVDGVPSSLGFDEVLPAHSSRQAIVFDSPDTFHYVGLRKQTFVLVDEQIIAP